MKSYVYNFLKFLVGWPLSLLAIFFIGKLLMPQLPFLITKLQHLNLSLLVYGSFSFLLFYSLRSYIWYRMLRKAGHTISWKDACFLWSASELKRYIPGNIWSFLGRAVAFSEKGITKKEIAMYLIIEAELLLLGAAVIALLALPFLLRFSLLPFTPFSTLFIPVLIFLGVGVYIFHKKVKIPFLPLPPFASSEIYFLVFLSTLSFLFFGLGHFLTIASFISLNPQLIWELTGFTVLAFLLGYLSLITPAGFGVREGILVFGLGKIIPLSIAAFSALFARIMLIVTELLFFFFAFIWYGIKSKKLAQIETWISNHKHILILCALFFIYIAYFTPITFLRYDNFYAGRFDLGNMAQTVWNTTRGRVFMFTNPNGTDNISRLAFHADFILVLLAPLYALWPNPKMLLLIQTVVIAAGAFFVYLIAKLIVKNKNISLTFALLYLINPSIQRANLYDFHAVTLATTFLLATYYYFLKKRYDYFLFFAILAGMCKEQVWLIIALFGLFLVIFQKKYIFGSILFIICTVTTFYLITHAIPQALGSQHFALSYYSDFGDSTSGIIKAIIFSPTKTITTLLQPDRIAYLKQLLLPLGYLPLLAPLLLIFAIPDLFINLLSNNDQLHQIYYQYTATISPFLFLAAIYGLYFLKKLFPKAQSTLLITYLLIVSLTAAYAFGPLPGMHEANTDMLTKQIPNRAFIDKYLSHIGKRFSVAASNNIGSHLSQRQRIYALPLGVDKADVIVFLLTDSEQPQSLKAERELVQKLKQDPAYQLSIEKDEFIVFKKKK
ncbi:MAG TPA: DUF2079 domain-containing protein [Methylomirabilota bacterium]|nr:DUF2079 domain-containing protein [Methylomirabilota bacterium]